MAEANPVRRLTEAEYLEIERRAECKSEFYDGEMFAMAGGSPAHSLIAVNLARQIGNRLEGWPRVVYNSDLRVKVQSSGWYTYPDISVVCGKNQLEGGDVLLNPILIVEVLSKAAEAYERGKKFELYGQLPSLSEYLLVHQHRPRVEQYIRQNNGGWLLQALTGLESVVTLASLGMSVPLAEVYAQVEFEPEPPHPERPPATPPL